MCPQENLMFTSVDPATVHRWDMRYSREFLECFNRRRRAVRGKGRVDETYVRVGGRWKYLFRAIDKHGQLNDVTLPDRRNTRAAYRFLRNALKTMSSHPTSSITTDKLASYRGPSDAYQREELLSTPLASTRWSATSARSMRSWRSMPLQDERTQAALRVNSLPNKPGLALSAITSPLISPLSRRAASR
jgi:transposase-like protein